MSANRLYRIGILVPCAVAVRTDRPRGIRHVHAAVMREQEAANLMSAHMSGPRSAVIGLNPRTVAAAPAPLSSSISPPSRCCGGKGEGGATGPSRANHAPAAGAAGLDPGYFAHAQDDARARDGPNMPRFALPR